jgi:dsDNA-binding SOS-regulon protein
MIEIEYVVRDHKGTERLRTTDKKAADAYDRALDNAERLAGLLRHDRVLPDLSEQDMEQLTIYLARNARNVERALKGKEPELGALDERSDTATDNIAPLAAAG